MAKKRLTQQALPGMEQPRVPAVEKAAAKYVYARDERMGLTKIEVERRNILLDEMHKAGLKVYEYDGKVVEIVAPEKVKVRGAAADDDEEADDESE